MGGLRRLRQTLRATSARRFPFLDRMPRLADLRGLTELPPLQLQPENLENARECFDLLGFVLVEIFLVEQKKELDINLLRLFPDLSKPREGNRLLSSSDIDVDSSFYWNVGRITREPIFPSFLPATSLPALPASAIFIDVKLCRFAPSHYVLCFEVGLSPDVTKELLDKLGQPYTGRVQWLSIEKRRGSVGMRSPEVQRQEVLAGYLDTLVDKIEHPLRPFLRGGYFTEFRKGTRLGRIDMISLKGLRSDPGTETDAWQTATREWSASLGLLWSASYNWQDAAVVERVGHFGPEYPWRLLIKPESFVREGFSGDSRAEMLQSVGNRLGGLASIVAFDRFAVIQQSLIAHFRNSVFKVARNKFLAYFLLWRHSQIHQRILSSRMLVQALFAGLTRSGGRLSGEHYAGNATFLYKAQSHVHMPNPFVQSLEQRYASIVEDMDRAAEFLSSILAARNLVAIYILTIAIFIFTALGVFDNVRRWASTSQPSPTHHTAANMVAAPAVRNRPSGRPHVGYPMRRF